MVLLRPHSRPPHVCGTSWCVCNKNNHRHRAAELGSETSGEGNGRSGSDGEVLQHRGSTAAHRQPRSVQIISQSEMVRPKNSISISLCSMVNGQGEINEEKSHSMTYNIVRICVLKQSLRQLIAIISLIAPLLNLTFPAGCAQNILPSKIDSFKWSLSRQDLQEASEVIPSPVNSDGKQSLLPSIFCPTNI